MSDKEHFELGKDLATTPGKVVFQNKLMQLIQYQPSTPQAYEKPLLPIPSWVNKYYILDLQEKNSFVKWAVSQGLTVFMISWVNPDAQHRAITFEQYMESGVLAAIQTIKQSLGCDQVNALGYCLGGVLLASTLAHLSHHNDQSIASATYLTTSFDFTDAGDIGLHIDEQSLGELDRVLDKKGYLDGRQLCLSFCLLKENELYWNYYVQNYLKGECPKPFDILYWNTDNTNVPAATHRFFLREFHMNNALMQRGAIALLGSPIDLNTVKTPVYVLATEKDHIAKWQSTYPARHLQLETYR